MAASEFVQDVSLLIFTFSLCYAVSEHGTAAKGITEDPLTIAVSRQGGSTTSSVRWFVSVNSAGKAEITVVKGTDRNHTRLELASAEMDKMRQALVREQFFDAKSEYGDIVPSGSWHVVTIIAGDQVKTVRLNYLGRINSKEVKNAAPVLRVLVAICDIVDPKGTVLQEARKLKEVLEMLEK